jgi:alpha-L-rhamnosidase
MDRRAFLSASARASAVVAAAGVTADVEVGPSPLSGAKAALAAPAEQDVAPGTLLPKALTVGGWPEPVGVDPDDCNFAWQLTAPGRTAMQHGYRVVVRLAEPGRAPVVWDSGRIASGRQAFVRYAGPSLRSDTSYQWTVQAKDAEGGWSTPSSPSTFVTALRPSDWTAKWVQPAALSPYPDRVTYLRKTFAPPSGPLRRAVAYLAAAHTCQLSVNGTRVDLGPSFSYPDESYFRCVDVTSSLQPGRRNAIGLLHRWYGAGQGRPASSPGVLFQLSVHYENGQHVTLGTDGTWREHGAEWLPSAQRNPDGADYVEWVDGRAHPVGWDQPGFDDNAWLQPVVIGPAGTAPFTQTFVQRTHVVDQPVEPVSLRTLPNGSVVADFGMVYAARPRVHFANGQGGHTVAMRVGYLLDSDGQVSALHGTQGTNLSFSYITRAGDQTFEALTYLGFRYLQLDDPGETLSPGQVQAVATHAAMPDFPVATFSTGNRTLNAVWKLNVRSCLFCAHEQFVDTPTREKGQFVWDASNESEGVMRAYGEQAMSWQGLRDVARGQARFHPDGRVNAVYPNGDGARDIPTFTARYPEWLWRYYVSTGDVDTAIILYPSVQRVAEYLWGARNGTTGLLDSLSDGFNGDPVYGYDLSVVADTASNALAVNAFTRIAQLADLAGDAAGAAVQRARAAQLSASVNGVLLAGNAYADGLAANGALSAHQSQEASALALAYNLVPSPSVAAVGAYVASLGLSVGPNHGLELLRGLAAADRWDDIVTLLTDASQPGWAHIVAKGGTFTWETWEPSDLIGDSMSHGWGSSALVAMSESLLGLTLLPPTAEGGVRVAISPPRSGLSHASGSIPTMAGQVTLAWSRRSHTFALAATVPPNAAATVAMPASSHSAVRESGSAIGDISGVSHGTYADGLAHFALGSGSYQFTSSL